jgi:hypothetical protein
VTVAADHPLGMLVDVASKAAVAQLDVALGPIPVHLTGASLERLTRLGDALVASAGEPWPPLTVVVATADELGGRLVPEEIRPTGSQILVARDRGLTALSNGPDGTLWLLDRERSIAVLWIEDFEALPLWEHTSPLRTAARWWATQHGAAMVHAGAVARDGRCLLLVGDSGAGKSTTTMACHGTDLEVLGDDFCFVEAPTDGQPALAHAMYRLAKLDEQALDLLPHLRDHVVGTAWRGKKLVDLGTPNVAPQPVVAVCQVVQEPGAATRVEPLSRVQALRAVAPSTMFQQRLWERETWDVLAATVRSAQCHRLVTGDLATVPQVVRDLLAAGMSDGDRLDGGAP